jgi:hypothetical protein
MAAASPVRACAIASAAEIGGRTIFVFVAGPPEKDVARRLQQSLSAHDSLAGLGVGAGSAMWIEHRRRRLLELEEQRLAEIGLEEHDEAAGPHAADANDLGCHVDELVSVEHCGSVRRQRCAVALEERLHVGARHVVEPVVESGDQWGLLDDSAAAVLDRRQFTEGADTVFLPIV